MSLYEYTMKMTAFKLKIVDQEYILHKTAWLAQQVKATKKVGKDIKPYYQSFNKFFDYAKQERSALGETNEELKDSNLSNLLRKANK